MSKQIAALLRAPQQPMKSIAKPKSVPALAAQKPPQQPKRPSHGRS